MKREEIRFNAHALLRLIQKGQKYGLHYFESEQRTIFAIRYGKKPKRKHLSKKFKTYYYYFKDNLAFYVICQEKKYKEYKKIKIKTVIIEKGRE